ncbi:DUF6992 family protein [Algoriphagus jejuensis]|uniref:DUF6992 family protein n=1 Tax=Algoriphagus jejuensis TaxID=419934 RepID=UPI0031D4A85A
MKKSSFHFRTVSTCFLLSHIAGQTRLDYNLQGMMILGSWAIGNMVRGGIGASRTTGETRAFHQMNLYRKSVKSLSCRLSLLACDQRVAWK